MQSPADRPVEGLWPTSLEKEAAGLETGCSGEVFTPKPNNDEGK